MLAAGTIVTRKDSKKTVPSKVSNQPAPPKQESQTEKYLLRLYKQKHQANESFKDFIGRFEVEQAENQQIRPILNAIKTLRQQNADLISDVSLKLKQMDQDELVIFKRHLDALYECGIETPLSKVSGFNQKKLDEFLKFNLYHATNEESAKRALTFKNLDLCVGNNGNQNTKPLVRNNIELHLRLQKILEKFTAKNLAEQAWNKLAVFNDQVKELFVNYKQLAVKKSYKEMSEVYQRIEKQITVLENAAQEIVKEVKAEIPPTKISTQVEQTPVQHQQPKKRRRPPVKKQDAHPQSVEPNKPAALPSESNAQPSHETPRELAPSSQPIIPNVINEPEIKKEPPKFVDIKLKNGEVDLANAIAQTKTYLNFIIENELKTQSNEIIQKRLMDLKLELSRIDSEHYNFSFPQDLPETSNINQIKAGFEALISLTKLQQGIANKGAGYSIFALPHYNLENPLEGFREISIWANSKIPQNTMPRVTPPSSPKKAAQEALAPNVSGAVSSISHESKQLAQPVASTPRIRGNSNQQPPKEKIHWKGFTIGGLLSMATGVILFFTVPIVGQVLGSALVAGTLGLTFGIGIGGAIEAGYEENKKPQKPSNQPATTTTNGNVYRRLDSAEVKTPTNVAHEVKNPNVNVPIKNFKSAKDLLTEFATLIKEELQPQIKESQYIANAAKAEDVENLLFSINIAPDHFNDNIKMKKMKLEIMQDVVESKNFSEQSKPRFLQAIIAAKTTEDFAAILQNINPKKESHNLLFRHSVSELSGKITSLQDFNNQLNKGKRLKLEI